MTSEATNGHHVPPIASASAPAVVENTELNRDVVQWGILTNAHRTGMIILPFPFSQLELRLNLKKPEPQGPQPACVFSPKAASLQIID